MMNAVATQDAIKRMERHLLQCEQTELQTRHYRIGCQVAREIVIPAHTFLTGAAHNLPHITTSIGDITVTTDDGPKRLIGVHTFPCRPGSKRAGFAHSATIFINYFADDRFSDESLTIEQIEVVLTDEAPILQTQRGLLPLYATGNLA